MVTPTTQTSSAPSASVTPKWLSWVLRANAAFCALCGLDLIVMASFLSPELGLSPLILEAAGVALIAYALFPWWVSNHLTRASVLTVTILDVLWVAGSALAFVIPTPLTMMGSILVEVVALVTVLFAVLQYSGWRRLS